MAENANNGENTKNHPPGEAKPTPESTPSIELEEAIYHAWGSVYYLGKEWNDLSAVGPTLDHFNQDPSTWVEVLSDAEFEARYIDEETLFSHPAVAGEARKESAAISVQVFAFWGEGRKKVYLRESTTAERNRIGIIRDVFHELGHALKPAKRKISDLSLYPDQRRKEVLGQELGLVSADHPETTLEPANIEVWQDGFTETLEAKNVSDARVVRCIDIFSRGEEIRACIIQAELQRMLMQNILADHLATEEEKQLLGLEEIVAKYRDSIPFEDQVEAAIDQFETQSKPTEQSPNTPSRYILEIASKLIGKEIVLESGPGTKVAVGSVEEGWRAVVRTCLLADARLFLALGNQAFGEEENLRRLESLQL